MKTCPQCNREQLFESHKCQWIDCRYIEGSEIDKLFKSKNINIDKLPKEIIMSWEGKV